MSCIFCKIINGEIPSKKAFENENIYAFYDIAPQAPVHILVIPKAHIESVDAINEENSYIVAEIFENIPKIAREAGIVNGYRVISNCGDDACQTVHHLHFHIVGGEQLSEKMV
jgi:histidine triad (HIT) family protein